MTIRKMVTAKRARDIDESTLSTAPEDCLRNFPNLKEIRKEQKTCLLNLARGKDFGDARPSAAAIEKFEDVERIRKKRELQRAIKVLEISEISLFQEGKIQPRLQRGSKNNSAKSPAPIRSKATTTVSK